jgi:hypothetical protein
MALDATDTTRANQWLVARNYKCPVCSGVSLQYDAANIPVAPISTTSQTIATVIVVCTSCGHVDFFSATLLGINP